MKGRRWTFWLITLAALLSIWGTFSLGRWQLARAAQKEHYQAQREAKAALPALSAPELAALPEPLSQLHRRVLLRGHWVAQRLVFLDNRQMNAHPGFYVLSPFQLEGSSATVLVQRGWVARDFVDREALPSIQTPQVQIEIAGRIAPGPSRLYELGESRSGLIRQNIDLADYAVETGLPLMSVSIQQTGAASEGLLREWPQVNTGVDKHYGYAFQWFALTGLIFFLYVWFQIGRRFISPRGA